MYFFLDAIRETFPTAKSAHRVYRSVILKMGSDFREVFDFFIPHQSPITAFAIRTQGISAKKKKMGSDFRKKFSVFFTPSATGAILLYSSKQKFAGAHPKDHAEKCVFFVPATQIAHRVYQQKKRKWQGVRGKIRFFVVAPEIVDISTLLHWIIRTYDA